jgi:hypothetical protein
MDGDTPTRGIQRNVRKRMKGMELQVFLRAACLLDVEKRGSVWVGSGWRPPSPVFPQMFILKGFKFNDLELLFPEGLRA